MNPLELLAAGVGAALAPLTSFVASVEAFVGAVSPGTMISFNLELKNLMATIGTAFAPMIEVFTAMVNRISGALLPAMEALAPVLELIAEVISSVLSTAIYILAQYVTALLKFLEPVVTLFRELLAPLDALYKVFAAIQTELFSMVMEIIGEALGLSDIFKDLTDAVKDAVRQVILFAARLAIAFGAGGFVDRIIARLQAQQTAQGASAVQGASIKSIEQIAKDIAQASLLAGGAGAKTQTEFLSDILGDLRAMRANPGNFWQDAVETITRWLNNLAHIGARIYNAQPFGANIEVPQWR